MQQIIAHTEAGWMKGARKKVIVYIPEMPEAELHNSLDMSTDHSLLTSSALQKRSQSVPGKATFGKRASGTIYKKGCHSSQ